MLYHFQVYSKVIQLYAYLILKPLENCWLCLRQLSQRVPPKTILQWKSSQGEDEQVQNNGTRTLESWCRELDAGRQKGNREMI